MFYFSEPDLFCLAHYFLPFYFLKMLFSILVSLDIDFFYKIYLDYSFSFLNSSEMLLSSCHKTHPFCLSEKGHVINNNKTKQKQIRVREINISKRAKKRYKKHICPEAHTFSLIGSHRNTKPDWILYTQRTCKVKKQMTSHNITSSKDVIRFISCWTSTASHSALSLKTQYCST